MAGPKRKSKGAYTEKRLSGLVPWKAGAPSPNPGGRPRQHREVVAELRQNADLIKDAILGLVHKGLAGGLSNSDKILSQHLWELWQAMYGRHSQSVLLGNGIDVGDDPNAPDSTGMATALLRAVQAEKADPAPARPRAPAEPIGEGEGDDDVILVDSAGTATAPKARPSAAERPIRPMSSAAEAPAPDPDPAHATEEEAAEAEEAPASSPPPRQPPPRSERQPRRPSGFPDFDRFTAERARTRAADEERARAVEKARAEGRPQISAAEAFPPDPRDAPEVVRFTLAGGGRIKRC